MSYQFPPVASYKLLQQRMQYLAKTPNLPHLNAEITARMIQARLYYPVQLQADTNIFLSAGVETLVPIK